MGVHGRACALCIALRARTCLFVVMHASFSALFRPHPDLVAQLNMDIGTARATFPMATTYGATPTNLMLSLHARYSGKGVESHAGRRMSDQDVIKQIECSWNITQAWVAATKAAKLKPAGAVWLIASDQPDHFFANVKSFLARLGSSLDVPVSVVHATTGKGLFGMACTGIQHTQEKILCFGHGQACLLVLLYFCVVHSHRKCSASAMGRAACLRCFAFVWHIAIVSKKCWAVAPCRLLVARTWVLPALKPPITALRDMNSRPCKPTRVLFVTNQAPETLLPPLAVLPPLLAKHVKHDTSLSAIQRLWIDWFLLTEGAVCSYGRSGFPITACAVSQRRWLSQGTIHEGAQKCTHWKIQDAEMLQRR